MAENDGCGRTLGAVFVAALAAGVVLFGTRFAVDGWLKPALEARGSSYPTNLGVWISLGTAGIVFLWILVSMSKPTPPRVQQPEPITYTVTVCADCKRPVDVDARVCPSCQARFSGEVIENPERRRREKEVVAE